jgi:2-dehydro-3-deoxygluconokinase
VTLGETMARLTPPGALRLEQAQTLEVHVGGSESNTAVGLARLGLRVCWLSRMTDNPVGHVIANAIRAQGVDTSQVVWTETDRVGLYFLEEADAPRESRVIYDRRDSAVSRMLPQHLPVDIFKPGAGRLLHLTGITLAISPTAYETAQRALELSRAAGWQLSFDVNYRGKLWTTDTARLSCEPLMQAANVIFLPLRDAKLLYKLDESVTAEAAIAELRRRYPQAVIIMTLGIDGAIASGTDGVVVRQAAFPAAAVCRLGRGDAFTAGFLYRWLANAADIPMALRYGAAMAALKYGITGDMPLIEPGEVQALVARGGMAGGIAR